MRVGDKQLGAPQILYKNTKSAIQAMTVESGAIAYATDTNELGYYNGTSWKWTKYDTVENADKLDGQHGSYYLNASNINAGTLSTDRFSAYSDLSAESRLGLVTGRLPDADLVRNVRTLQEDFTSTTPTGWGWLTGTGYDTPGSVTLFNNTMIWCVNNGGSTNKSFFYRSAPSGFNYIYAGVSFFVSISGCYVGIRLDDGSDSNYIECYIKYDTSASPYYRFCLKQSGTEYEATAMRSSLLPFPLTIGFNRSGASWASWIPQLYIEGQVRSLFSLGTTQTWTPTRIGWIIQWQGSTWHAALIDWIGGDGTW